MKTKKYVQQSIRMILLTALLTVSASPLWNQAAPVPPEHPGPIAALSGHDLDTGDTVMTKEKREPENPPREVLAACSGKHEGDDTTFSDMEGETLQATCMVIEDQLVAFATGLAS